MTKMMFVQMHGPNPWHKWLERFDISNSISGKNSLLNTHTMMQRIQGVIRSNTKLMCKTGFFGEMWDEKKGRSQIFGAMDQLLMSCILPDLIMTAQSTVFRSDMKSNEGTHSISRIINSHSTIGRE